MNSLRVEPEIVKDAIRFCCNYNLNCTWDKKEHDSYTLFTGSKASIQRLNDFITGWKYHRENQSPD